MRRTNAFALACLVAFTLACGPSATGAQPTATAASFVARAPISAPLASINAPLASINALPTTQTPTDQPPAVANGPTQTAVPPTAVPPTAVPPAASPPAADPPPTIAPPTPSQARFSIDLYSKGAFIRQLTTYYCVPASIQTMLNLVGGRPYDTTRATQDALYRLTRDDFIQPYWGKGAQPEGWASVLTHDGAGPYRLGIRTNAGEAIHLAAQQLRATGRPVGLLVWRGFHAWVMSGFTSIGDPAKTDTFKVTGVFVEDPWYPRISRTYGRGQAPDTYLSTNALARFFLPYDQHGEGGLDKDGKYVVVIPTR